MKLYLDAHLRSCICDLHRRMPTSRWNAANQDIIGDILSSEPGNRVSGHKGWGRKRGGAPETVGFMLDEEYDRSEILPVIPEDQLGLFRLWCEEVERIGRIGFKSSIATVGNLTLWERHEIGGWLRRPLKCYPALIPQVWLQHIHDPKLGPSDPLKREAYSRVDFVVLWNDKKLVIEIDGPEHYAEWDRAERNWHISEVIYTRNLVRERRLRKQGWLFFRLSNQEVEEASSWYDIDNLIGFSELVEKERPEFYLFH